jgi:hypothetical protein
MMPSFVVDPANQHREPSWTHGGNHAELKALADLPKVLECPFEMFNGLIVFAGYLQEVAVKVDDTSATLARQ